MAKTFQSLKSTRLGMLDFFQFGKYQNCRVDSIVQMDYNYIIFLHNNNKNMFEPKVIAECEALKTFWAIQYHYEEEVKPFEDVPF
jgi:hypothetical protein